MLILFDIDATMITTGGAGIRAMVAAGKELFGPQFTAEGIPVAGRLDPLIMGEMLDKSGVRRTPTNLAALRKLYVERLAQELTPGRGRALPGVIALLDALEGHRDVARGVLTGNFEESGWLKLRHCGIEPSRFHFGVWGDESPHDPPARDHLPPVGMARYRERFGREIASSAVTVIGDTPHDVACARAHGCRSIAVATGSFTVDQLVASGADLVVPDLSQTESIVRWLVA
jgi:phosphoglycolate phosphatase-like HAD superfamily hydrolase